MLLASEELLARPMFQSFSWRRSIDIRNSGCQKGNVWRLAAFCRNQLKVSLARDDIIDIARSLAGAGR
ncbi:hypothetical protein BC361_06015 [Ensifer sp. LC54]|nr:hypothetical protein BC361_06015 [Ensifer sp. LC54]OCP27385.1 hypothetical protein BC363_14865 [Ensifer sp. LC384]